MKKAINTIFCLNWNPYTVLNILLMNYTRVLELFDNPYLRFKSFIVWSIVKRNWVFATNSDFLISISLEPNVVDPRYFKLWILLDQIFWAWNIKGFYIRGLNIWVCGKDSTLLKISYSIRTIFKSYFQIHYILISFIVTTLH